MTALSDLLHDLSPRERTRHALDDLSLRHAPVEIEAADVHPAFRALATRVEMRMRIEQEVRDGHLSEADAAALRPFYAEDGAEPAESAIGLLIGFLTRIG